MRIIVFETRTGRVVYEPQFVSWSYDTGILAGDKISLVIPAYTPEAVKADLPSVFTPLAHSIILVDDEIMPVYAPAAGVITSWVLEEDPDGLDRLKVECAGVEKLFEARHVRKFPGWPLLDSSGKPVTTYDLHFVKANVAGVMGALVAESLKWDGAGLPLGTPGLGSGALSVDYLALDGKPVKTAIDDLAAQTGVEYDFVPTWDDEKMQAGWQMRVGDDDGLIVAPAGVPVFPLGGVEMPVGGLTQEARSERLLSASFMLGGKTGDTVLAARAVTSQWTSQGFPYLEEWDNSHSTEIKINTLAGFADRSIADTGYVMVWETRVRWERAPRLRHGQFVEFDALGTSLMPDGVYRRRVLSVARSSDSEAWLKIQLAGVTDGEIYS